MLLTILLASLLSSVYQCVDGKIEISKEVQVFADTVIKKMTLGFSHVIPDTIKIPDLKMPITKGCTGSLEATGGTVTGLSSMRAKPLFYYYDEMDAMHVNIPIHFSDLHIKYEFFHLECWPLNKRGNADLKLMKNEIKIGLRIAAFSKFVDKIIKRQCMFSVKELSFTEIGSVQAKLQTDGRTGGMISSMLFPYLANEIKKTVLEKMSTKVTNKLSNALPAHSAWICRDADLQAIIRSTGGAEENLPTPQFDDFATLTGSTA